MPLASPQATIQGTLRAPVRIALGAQTNLYVTDASAGSLSVFDSAGQLLASKSGLQRPLAVAAGRTGSVFVAEESIGRVTALSAGLATQYVLGAGSGEFLLPGHIAVDTALTNGLTYVTDSRAHLVKYYLGATFMGSFGGKGQGPGQFDFPTGIHIGPTGELFVVDQHNDRVQVFDRAGNYQREFGLPTPADTTNRSGRAQGISGDASGRLYIADAFQGEVKVFDTAGAYLGAIGTFGDWTGQLRTPTAVAWGGANRLYVVSLNSSRVEVFVLGETAPATARLQVVSDHGSPQPPAGLVTNALGALITNTVDAWVTLNSTQFVCIGWTMTGQSPLSGVSNVLVFTHTNDAVLTWLWKTQFLLTASAGPHGSVSPTSSWWDAGATAVVTAVPDPYYHFTYWPDYPITAANPLSVPISAPLAISANFAENLATNGTPEWWLASFDLTNTTWDAAALDDQDGDHVPTWQEWMSDTVPTNPASFLGFSRIANSPTGAVLNWHGGVQATQYLDRLETPVGASPTWRTLTTNLPPVAIQTNWLDPDNAGGTIWYRLRSAR